MPGLGLIGYPLSHSFSPGYFKDKFEKEGISDWNYKAYPLERMDEFPKLWDDNPDLIGINVTIPYKEKVIPYLDRLDETAAQIGAVNTIIKTDDGFVGYNTDAYGFQYSLETLMGKDRMVGQALILGTGGASKAVAYVLASLGIHYQYVSRNSGEGKISYDELSSMNLESYPLIVNTTPLGMYPNTDKCPELDYSSIGIHHYMIDLIYNPSKTLFLEKGEKGGAKTMNGLLMLHQQAERAWQIWTGRN